MEIHILRLYQRKCIESYIPLRRDLVVQLSYRTAAQIPRVLVLRIHVLDPGIYTLKFLIPYDGFSPYDQFALICDPKRDIPEHPGIIRDDLAHLAISAGDGLIKLSAAIGQHDRKPVKLPGDQHLLIPRKTLKLFNLLRLVKGQHRALVTLLGQFAQDLIPHIHRRTVCKGYAKLLLKPQQFIIQPVILPVAHNLRSFLIIRTSSVIQLLH